MSDLQLFADQFDDSTDLQNLALALTSPTIGLEQALQDLLDKRWIDTAVGIQLDKLGDILGMARFGRTDEAYRNALRFQIFINTSQAQPETIIRATREISLGTLVRYWENYPAGFQIFTDGPNVLDITGSVIQQFIAILENSDPLELDDDEGLLLQTSFDSPTGLADFLKSIAPAGVNAVTVSFSLGETPLFGFGGDFITAYLTLDDDEDFNTDNNEILDLSLDEVSPSTDGFIGFADFELFGFVLDDDEPLELSIEINIFNAVVAIDDGFGDAETTAFYLDNGNYLEFFTRAPVIYDAAVILDDGLGPIIHDAAIIIDDGLGPIEELFHLDNDEPLLFSMQGGTIEELFHLDNDEPLLFYSEDGITEETTLLVFDSNQPAIGGGKLVEAIVSGF